FDGGFLMALLFAFAGGLILNLMPCVLPVISLKIFSFVKMSGEKRSEIVRHGVLFTLGVLVSFWALAGALIALQASGAAVGWGFQLQDPLFVGILTAIIFVFGLSLFGVFEFGTTFSSWAGQQQSNIGQSSSGKASAFFSGVLATTVATPCTGPFLGPAIGFAMTLSALGSLTVFTFLALGMASPYLLISLFPSLIRFLPKPGKWMVTFKEILGFCMVATALWLVWVFAAQTSMMATSALLVALFGLSVGSWIYGKWGTPLRKRPVRIVAYALTLATLLGSTGLVLRASQMIEEPIELVAVNDPTAESKDIHGWEPFNKERLDYLRSQGIPVFIDFTARWCLICQANHMVLSTEEVEGRMAEAGVVKMLADWTKNDPEITAELKKFGRSGVPLYLLYGKEEEPTILPQMLSPDLVVEYIDTTL
ncbi:MAG: thioredoxin family protein, partial [Chlamydiia bacterium]|nr:thioredoxin family protein [Chlamydiia bacterium]